MPFINPYSNSKTRRKSHLIIPIVTILSLIFIYNANDGGKQTSLLKTFITNTDDIKMTNGEQSRNAQKDSINKIHKKKSGPSTAKKVDLITRTKNRNVVASPSTFIPTLRNKKIFFEVVTVGSKQFSYLEDIIDVVRDLCEAGAHVSFHITSSNCDPNAPMKKDEDGNIIDECPIRNQSSEDTDEDNFNVETISHLNERVRCRNPEGSLDTSIHLVSPDWG